MDLPLNADGNGIRDAYVLKNWWKRSKMESFIKITKVENGVTWSNFWTFIWILWIDRIEVEGEVGGEGVGEGEGEGEVDVHCRGCRIVLRGCRTVHKSGWIH